MHFRIKCMILELYYILKELINEEVSYAAEDTFFRALLYDFFS